MNDATMEQTWNRLGGFEVDVFIGWLKKSDMAPSIKLLQLSMYFEWYDLNTIKIGEDESEIQYHNSHKLPIQTFLKPDETFSDKFKTEFRFGFKIGIDII